MYEVNQETFRTPKGRSVTMVLRADTNDHNTLRSCLDEDEYRLAELNLSGMALDVGAHIGGVTVALLIDNPDLRVIAVEAVPPNVDLLRQNLERNGLSDRAIVLHAAAGKGRSTLVRWSFSGNETADHHTFIGNAVMPAVTLSPRHHDYVPTVTLAALVKEHGPFAFAKIDCEGCEFSFLVGPALAEVALIRGEVHGVTFGLIEALYPTHLATFPSTTPGPFEAVRRG